MHFGARAYSLNDVEFLAKAGFAFAEIDWKDPHLVTAQLAELAALQAKYGIFYLAHGPNERNPFDIDEIVEVMGPAVCRLLALAPELGITLYTQHLWLDPRFVSAGAIARKLNLLETWSEHSSRLHDNHGGSEVKDDLHLPIGEGCIDFVTILRALRGMGYGRGFSFETRLEYVEQSRDAICKMWGTAVDSEQKG